MEDGGAEGVSRCPATTAVPGAPGAVPSAYQPATVGAVAGGGRSAPAPSSSRGTRATSTPMVGILIRVASDAGSGRVSERSRSAPAAGRASSGEACVVVGGREPSPSGTWASRTIPTSVVQARVLTEGTLRDGAPPGFGAEPFFMWFVPPLDGGPRISSRSRGLGRGAWGVGSDGVPGGGGAAAHPDQDARGGATEEQGAEGVRAATVVTVRACARGPAEACFHGTDRPA